MMKAVYSPAHIDQLVDSRSYDAMLMLCAYVEAASSTPDEPRRGLPIPLFVFIEALTWLSQSARSGAWTYFEATTSARQEATRTSLTTLGCDSLAQHYSFGMRHWEDATLMRQLDQWLNESEKEIDSWLWEFLDSHRDQLRQLLCPKSG